MSLLDDARRLNADMPARGGSGGRCYYCLGGKDAPHEPDCPWLSVPKIVAALEAAEAVLWAVDESDWQGDRLPRRLHSALDGLEIAMGDDDRGEE